MTSAQPSTAPPAEPPALTFSRRGILFVVSAPSGAGKSTLLNALRPAADFEYSVSCTTRAPRPGEIDGEDYHFLSREEFVALIEAGAFLEHAEVHGKFYGTRRDRVLSNLEAGVDVLLDIDVQGARSVRACDEAISQSLADIFIMPPSLAELRHRLLRRGTETEAQIDMRLQNAAVEIEAWREYRYTLISGSMEEDLQKFRAIMRAERYLTPEDDFHMSAPVVVLGVTGSIAAYKAADLASKMVKRGWEVHVVMTHGAQQFITPLTLQTLSRNPVVVSVFDESRDWMPGHLALADRASLLLVAPATANIIAEFAHGLASHPLAEIALATLAPVLIAPAMNGKMWEHAATRRNVEILRERGVQFIGPEESGTLACGYEGSGRLWEVEEIVTRAAEALRCGKPA